MEKNYSVFGNGKTHLVLSDKAFEAYSNTYPLEIRERATENGYVYDIIGIVDIENLSENELNECLEGLAD